MSAELNELLRSCGSDAGRLCAGVRQLEALHGETIFPALLHRLTHLTLEPQEAREHWSRIGAHREALEERLGEPVDLRVALLHYFMQVEERLQEPKIIECSLFDRAEASIYLDELTGLLNYRYLTHNLPREIARSRRLQTPVSLVMLDIDDFKGYNDRNGHEAGNTALAELSDLLAKTVGEYETPMRYGGEEFAIVLPSIPKPTAMEIAAGLCAAVEKNRFCHLGAPAEPLTISLGVATCPADAADAAELIRRADEAMYAAKKEGRNRVRPYGDSTRSYRRRPTSIACRFRTFRNDSRSAMVALVSEGGLMLVSSDSLPEGTVIDVNAPGSAPDQEGTIGRVVASDPRGDGQYEIGVAFVDRKAAESSWVRELIDES